MVHLNEGHQNDWKCSDPQAVWCPHSNPFGLRNCWINAVASSLRHLRLMLRSHSPCCHPEHGEVKKNKSGTGDQEGRSVMICHQSSLPLQTKHAIFSPKLRDCEEYCGPHFESNINRLGLQGERVAARQPHWGLRLPESLIHWKVSETTWDSRGKVTDLGALMWKTVSMSRPRLQGWLKRYNRNSTMCCWKYIMLTISYQYVRITIIFPVKYQVKRVSMLQGLASQWMHLPRLLFFLGMPPFSTFPPALLSSQRSKVVNS